MKNIPDLGGDKRNGDSQSENNNLTHVRKRETVTERRSDSCSVEYQEIRVNKP